MRNDLHISTYTDMCVCVRVYVYVLGFLDICMHMYASGDTRLALGVFLSYSILYSLRISSVIPEVAEKARCQPVSSGESPSSVISVLESHVDYHTCVAFL